ncbi:putative murein peptide carboxypeptidase [compost metagenome]
MIPEKLLKGDVIRVISPARTLSIISDDTRNLATQNLTNELGLKVTFSKYANDLDDFMSTSIEKRVEDLHEAFLDKNVKAVITSIGGFNCNQLLSYIDYSIIKNNPKIFCGYSDITAISNAIFKKSDLVTYYGPHFSTFGMKKGLDYTTEYFNKCLMLTSPYRIDSSKYWSDDEWYINQEKRFFIKNSGCKIINKGIARGQLVGGNLSTFNLLQGTQYMPDLKNKVVFLEDCDLSSPEVFDRQLQSVIHQANFSEVRALLLGRFQRKSNMKYEYIYKILKTKRELNNIPVIIDLDFGHTTPTISLPIGGVIDIKASNTVEIEVLKH